MDVLYGCNLFDLSGMQSHLALLPSILPETLFGKLTRVYIFWSWFRAVPVVERKEVLTRQDRAWIQSWESIAAMQSLNYLSIQLRITGALCEYWIKHEDDALLPVRKVTRPRHFKLEVPFPANPTGTIGKDLEHIFIRIGPTWLGKPIVWPRA